MAHLHDLVGEVSLGELDGQVKDAAVSNLCFGLEDLRTPSMQQCQHRPCNAEDIYHWELHSWLEALNASLKVRIVV